MSKTAIISVDGHVRASRSDYRNYVEKQLPRRLRRLGREREEAAGAPESGNLSAGPRPDVAVGLGPPTEGHGEPGSRGRGAVPERSALPDKAGGRRAARSPTPSSTARRGWPTTAGWPTSARRRRAVGPARRSMSFDDVELAVGDIHWAKEHGLGGVMMPALLPGGTFFFDPALDPVWAACVEVGLPDQPARRYRGAGLRAARVRRHHDAGSRALLLLRAARCGR